MGLSGGVETANLTTVMKHYKITNTESYESIKLSPPQRTCKPARGMRRHKQNL